MKKNSRSDIVITETFRRPDSQGQLVSVDVPSRVRIEYFTPDRRGTWVCERDGNTFRSCSLSHDGKTLICNISLSRKYLGEGPLLKVITEKDTDLEFPSSTRLNGYLASTGVDLWAGPPDSGNVDSVAVIAQMQYGYSAYELAVKLGQFEGTEEEYVRLYLDAVALCQEMNEHPMRINTTTYTWERWDAENNTYVDTGIKCWTPLYAFFRLDPATGTLNMYTEVSYAGGTFAVDQETGQLTLTI